MARYALNKNHILVDAQSNCQTKEGPFKCPFCGEKVFYKKEHHRKRGETVHHVRSHFSHTGDTDEIQEAPLGYCVSNYFYDGVNETAAHKSAKKETQNILNATINMYFRRDQFEPVPEFRYPGRRADIAVVNKDRKGFLNYEIQLSPIGFESIRIRTQKDRINHVGQTVYGIKRVSTRQSSVSQGTLLNSCLQEYGVAQTIEKVVTKEGIIIVEDLRTGYQYPPERRVLDYYDKFNQHHLLGRHEEIIDVTTDTTAEMIYNSVIEHEKLQKNPQIFDMGSNGKPCISRITDISDIENDDHNTKKYETPLKDLDLELLHQDIQLLCQTNQGYIGAAIEFDTRNQKARVILVGERGDCPHWIRFEELSISIADLNSVIASRKTTKSHQEKEYSHLNEYLINTIDFNYGFNPIKQFNPEIATKIQFNQQKHLIKVGARATWTDAPTWWNKQGELIREIKNGKVYLDYLGRGVPIEQIIILK